MDNSDGSIFRSIIKLFDDLLELENVFKEGPYNATYQVKRKGRLYVLKMASSFDLEDFDVNYLAREADALMDLQDFDGITHLVELYADLALEGCMVSAIMKEFFPGKHENIPLALRDKSINIICGLHDRDYAFIDVYKENLVIGEGQLEIKIIDMDQYVLRIECDALRFKQYMNSDFYYLRRLF